MRSLFTYILVFTSVLGSFSARAYSSVWQAVDKQHVPSKGVPSLHPLNYSVYQLNDQYIHDFLFGLSSEYKNAQVLELPMADGSIRDFRVWAAPTMDAALAVKYPGIKTYTAEAVSDPRITAKLDYTAFGFHAMIFNGENTSFIDPYSRENDGFYMVHYKRDEVRTAPEHMVCKVKSSDEELGQKSLETANSTLPRLAYRTLNGYNLHTYRLALACDYEYAVAVTGSATPTKTAVMSAMVTTMNRVNGVYERELSVHMNIIANDDTLICITSATSPYTDNDGNAMLGENQTQVDNLIGNANYDIGHVFSTGGGGVATLQAVCSDSNQNIRAQGVTGNPSPTGDGFDIDYVAHEMGHQFGAEHTFNNNQDGSCATNANHQTAYEPGSGSTIMAYAGICGPDDLQPHSDAYFAAVSLRQISNFITTGDGNTCGTTTITNNKPVGLPLFSAVYDIPYLTPFEFTAPVAIDSVVDSVVTYCWEEADLGRRMQGQPISIQYDYGAELVNTHLYAPMFRSFSPDTNRTRVFPKMDSILRGTYTYAGPAYENREGEKIPDSARNMRFKLTVRNIAQGYGSFLFPDDTIHLNIENTGSAFAVTSQAATGTIWYFDSSYAVTWSVVGTNTAPINCDSVDIYLAADGRNFTTLLGRYPNTGTATVTAPILNTTVTTARLKVKAANNIFFNVNSKAFTIKLHPQGVAQVAWADDVKVYPVPASESVTISINNIKELNGTIYNAIGQSVWQGTVKNEITIPVNAWAKGVYHLQLNDLNNGGRLVKSLVIQ